MSRIGNMWFGCSTRGRNLLPLITLGIYVMCNYYLAMLVDGDWIMIHTWKVESYLIMDNIKVATLKYIWVDWLRHLGNPVLPGFGNPGVPM